MTTLNLSSTQQVDLKTAFGAANTAYNLNNGGQALVVGQALQFVDDLAGRQAGYTSLGAQAPLGYTIAATYRDASGLDAFVAYNPITKAAIVGIAGINGVAGSAPGSAADTAQTI
jgi:hypothetical protein